MDRNKNMRLLEHLGELRKRLAVVILFHLVAMVVIFNYADVVLRYFLVLNPGMQLVYITPSELFLIYVNISVLSSVVLCSPITLYQLWAFVEEGLYKHEKVLVMVSLFAGLLCFACGVLFCYLIVLPFTLSFLYRFGISEIQPMVSVESYTSFINTLLLSTGIVFEMPVIAFLLTKLGVLKASFLKKKKGLLTVVIFIIAAIVTPPDVVSQLMLAIPMLLLFNLSIFISALTEKNNEKRKKSAQAQEAAA